MILVTSCATSVPFPSEQIIGTWRSQVGGFDVTTTYTIDEVTVDGFDSKPYVLNGSELVIEDDAISARTVSFPSKGEMVQVDNITETVHVFTRIGG
ncbi:MAG: hypothetical protein JJ890_02085 [Pseudomonadales bacterium]|nr:hypothetical protein [Pseudomonadales bacterium]